MSEFPIERDVPVPDRRPLGVRAIYPWNDMQPGDSFWAPRRDGESRAKAQARLVNSARHAAKKRGLRYATRQEGEGVRVWLLPNDDASSNEERIG